jgi:phosphonate transport system substrate-binding protein
MSWLRYLLVFCCLFAPALAPAQEKSTYRPLTIGLMPYLTTRTLLANYQPIAVALEQELKQPIQLLTAPDFDTFLKRVFDGEYDVVLLAPHYARLAIKEFGYTPLLVHKAPIRGVLVTSRNHPLSSTEELRGQTIAVAERSALLVIVGALILSDEGLKEGKDYQFVETVSHSSALHSAISGKSRAALISFSTLSLAAPELQKDTVIWRELNRIPGQFYIAHNRLPSERQKAIKAALLAFENTQQGQQFFEKTKHGGFRDPNREDAEFLDRLLPETRRQLANLLR